MVQNQICVRQITFLGADPLFKSRQIKENEIHEDNSISDVFIFLKAEHWNTGILWTSAQSWETFGPGTQPLGVFPLPQVEGVLGCACVFYCVLGEAVLKSISPAKIHTQPGIKRAETYQQVLNALPQSLDQIHHHSRFIFPLFICPTNSCRIHQAYILIFSVT